MLVNIGTQCLWQADTWADMLGTNTSTWDTMEDITWTEDDPNGIWADWFADISWSDDDPLATWREFWNIHDRLPLDNSIGIHHRIEERSTAELEVLDLNGIYNFEVGQEVKFYEDNLELLYGGLITENTINRMTLRGDKTHKVLVSDYHLIAEHRYFNKAYETPTGDQIVYDILDVLYEDDIRIGEIEAGDVLQDQLFSFMTCSDALDKVSALCGKTWWIAEDKKLYWVDYTTYPAVWNILDGSEIMFNGEDCVSAAADYRNVQLVSGGKAITDERTEPIKGNGTTKSFALGFPLAKEPRVVINGLDQSVGIKGIETGFQWYWNEGDNTVYQDNNETALTGSESSAVVIYIGSYKALIRVQRAAEITRSRFLWGFGSGKIENIYIDQTILDINAAIEMAQQMLANYARAGRLIHYKTLTPGLVCGALQNVTLDHFGIDNMDFLINSLDITVENYLTIYAVEECEGPVNPSWAKIYCRLADYAKKQAIQNVSENDSIQGLEEFSKTWLSSYHPNPFIGIYASGTPADIDFPCLDDEDLMQYVVLYSGGTEFFRKLIAEQIVSPDGAEIDTIAIVLSQEANEIAISHVGLWGGVGASMTAGTGIELEKFAYSKTKSHLESLQYDFSDLKGF